MNGNEILNSLKAYCRESLGLSEIETGRFIKKVGLYLVDAGTHIEIRGESNVEKAKKLKGKAYTQNDQQNNVNTSVDVTGELSPKVTTRVKPTVLVLFIKADANTLIDAIKQKGALYKGADNELFVNSMKMWVGTVSQFENSSVKAEFKKAENTDSFVKEYDYIAMRFQLDKEYSGYNSGADSYERNQFFENICKDNVRLIECSERLSFNDNTTTEVYDVYGR